MGAREEVKCLCGLCVQKKCSVLYGLGVREEVKFVARDLGALEEVKCVCGLGVQQKCSVLYGLGAREEVKFFGDLGAREEVKCLAGVCAAGARGKG